MNGKIILVVDDDDDARGVLCELLSDAGYRCVEAANGQDAIRRLSATGERPALILLDLMMPRMNGWQFREWQQQSAEHSTIPVVILSATTDGAEEAKKLAAAEFIAKPIDLDELLATVKRYCPGR
jgi:two-component system chemotaxis response regulator CheY